MYMGRVLHRCRRDYEAKTTPRNSGSPRADENEQHKPTDATPDGELLGLDRTTWESPIGTKARLGCGSELYPAEHESWADSKRGV